MKVYIGPYLSSRSKKTGRAIRVRIDPYDTWGMDHTLALIILPMLKQLKEANHGAPHTDDADVPDELKSTAAPPKKNEWDSDENFFVRWDWIMDEMIWAFEQIIDDDNDAQFHSGTHDIKFKDIEYNGQQMSEMVKGPNDTHVFDKEGWKVHDDRISNGLRLFGIYYRGLWD